jgi:hypothetical protein
MASTVPPRGSHVPGGGTELHFDVTSYGADAEMAAHHEAAHLELNHLTAFGVLLRAVGLELESDRPSVDAEGRLAELVGLCRTTHEIFATTSGVWLSSGPFDQALAAYPSYDGFFQAGRTLAGSLREGSFAANIAMASACWVAMQPPIGSVLADRELREVSADLIGDELRPDHRMRVLLDAQFDLAMVDVALPDCWRDEELRSAKLEVPRFQETFMAVASAYYDLFAKVLFDAGLSTLVFDGHMSDPVLRAWLERHPAPVREVVRSKPGAAGVDPFWAVTLSDGERVVLHPDRELIAMHLGDLPAHGEGRDAGRDTFVQGEPDSTSILVVVRPLRTLFKQYRLNDTSAALLRAAATDGIITACRAEAELASGRQATFLGVLSSRAQLDALADMPSRHGILASVSETCTWFPSWSNYWGFALQANTHTVKAADLPRRLWLDALSTEHASIQWQPFTMTTSHGELPVTGLLVWFGERYEATDPPLLVLGSRRTVVAFGAALAKLFGRETLKIDPPPEWEKTSLLARQLVDAEPWLDARSLQDLPDFAKMSDPYSRVGRLYGR